jgi:hypothetical protein
MAIAKIQKKEKEKKEKKKEKIPSLFLDLSNN